MVAEIDPFLQYHAATIYYNPTSLKVGIFKFIYFFTLSTKINENLLHFITFYDEFNEHTIFLWMFTDLLRLKVGFNLKPTCHDVYVSQNVKV